MLHVQVEDGIAMARLDDGATNAVTRETLEALKETVARVNGNADRAGSLSVGKDADLVVVDKNIFSLPVDEIATAKVLLTLLAGKPVYGSLDKL